MLQGAHCQSFKSITARPPWLWLQPGAAGVCSAVMAGATSSTRFNGVAVPGMASWGDPLGTTVSGVLIRDRGVERLDVGVALRIVQVCRRLGPCLRPCS